MQDLRFRGMMFLAASGALRCQRLLMEGFDEGNMYLGLWVFA